MEKFSNYKTIKSRYGGSAVDHCVFSPTVEWVSGF